MLIVLEGIDGAGTTTQAQRVAEALRAAGRDVHLTREPSDGPVGRLLREMLAGKHAPAGERIDASTMALLFAADRADHLQREVLPALARGALVISDRWYHSSLAYQGEGAEREWIRRLNMHARRPELTVILEVPAEVAASRRSADGRAEEIFDALELQRRIARGYKEVATALAAEERIVLLDGTRGKEELTVEIVRMIEGLA